MPASTQRAVEAERTMSSQQLATPVRETAMPAAAVQAPNFTPSIVPRRDQILRLEEQLRNLPQLTIETRHYHVAGLYAREIFIPAGAVLTGKVHKAEHLNIVSQGELIVWTEAGMKQIAAPFVLPSYPGAKRVGLALKDTTWVSIHATDKIDLAELEQELVESNPALDQEVQKWLGSR